MKRLLYSVLTFAVLLALGHAFHAYTQAAGARGLLTMGAFAAGIAVFAFDEGSRRFRIGAAAFAFLFFGYGWFANNCKFDVSRGNIGIVRDQQGLVGRVVYGPASGALKNPSQRVEIMPAGASPEVLVFVGKTADGTPVTSYAIVRWDLEIPAQEMIPPDWNPNPRAFRNALQLRFQQVLGSLSTSAVNNLAARSYVEGELRAAAQITAPEYAIDLRDFGIATVRVQ